MENPKECVADKCDCCDRDIMIGEEYYDVDGITICNNCINDYRKTIQSKESKTI